MMSNSSSIAFDLLNLQFNGYDVRLGRLYMGDNNSTTVRCEQWTFLCFCSIERSSLVYKYILELSVIYSDSISYAMIVGKIATNQHAALVWLVGHIEVRSTVGRLIEVPCSQGGPKSRPRPCRVRRSFFQHGKLLGMDPDFLELDRFLHV